MAVPWPPESKIDILGAQNAAQMQDSAVLENRERIFDYISNYPGTHMRQIARQLNIHLGTLRYHLDHLEKNGLIVSQKQNNLKIYFASGRLRPEEKALAQLLQQKRFRDIILVLIDAPGSTFSQIAERLSMSPSTASKYINILDDRRILSHERVGRSKRYRINDEKSIIEILKTYKKFMADVSYEIRMPMNAIVGMTSLLLNDDMTPEQKDFVETIRISADALMAIVNDLLDFSKIEREKTELEIQTFNLRGCIEDAVQSVADKAAAKGLNLAYMMDKTSPSVIIGDPKRLRQILINLLDDAIGQANLGEVSLYVSSTCIDPLYEIHFEVRDTGPGIPPDGMKRLFEPGEASSSGDVDGAASSLSESRDLIELMSGRIWAESKIGEGSSIHFTIKTKHVPAVSPLTGVQLLLDGKRILIVADSSTNCRIIEAQTDEWGMIPRSVRATAGALQLVGGGERFDAVLIDLGLEDSELSFQENVQKIGKSLPLVALAASGRQIPPGLFAGHLTRPITQSGLFKALSDVFAEKSATGLVRQREGGPRALRVLLAEDNLSNQKVILMMLKRLGYEAKTVSNGKEALSALEREQFDIVLMDVRMPEMDGLQATRIIRQRIQNNLKIIAITAYALRGDRERCLEAGMDDYLSKPVRMEELAEILRKYQPT